MSGRRAHHVPRRRPWPSLDAHASWKDLPRTERRLAHKLTRTKRRGHNLSRTERPWWRHSLSRSE